jgi:hypothetical protein
MVRPTGAYILRNPAEIEIAAQTLLKRYRDLGYGEQIKKI